MKHRWVISICLLVSAGVVMAADDGAAVYKKACVKCHGDEGKGDGPTAKMLKGQSMGDFSNKAAMSKVSDQDLAKVISEGGAAVGKSKIMPAHKDKLTDAEIKAVVSYIKTLQK